MKKWELSKSNSNWMMEYEFSMDLYLAYVGTKDNPFIVKEIRESWLEIFENSLYTYYN